MVTNQSGVARGMYTQNEVNAVHRRIDELLAAAGAKVDGWYFCPHHPKHTGPCDCGNPPPACCCRRPREHEIDLANSVMVGDRLSDLEAGRAAGCRTVWLVKTGYGAEVVRTTDLTGVNVAEDLADAVRRTFAGEA